MGINTRQGGRRERGIVPARLRPAIANEVTTVIAGRQPSDFMQSTPTTRPLARTPGLPSAVGDG